ncbi:hypothetical protein [Vreelandella venusta]|uniref:hypothetical protein n=1 Tax=Vreelandella venusta TaxID=44935 RepID=UPI003F67D18B
MKKHVSAYCFASGEIQVGSHVPGGAVVLATGPRTELKREIDVVSRLAYDNRTLLVPGMPESRSVEGAINAVVAFVKWAKGRSSPACEWRDPAELEQQLREKVGITDDDGHIADPEAFETEA